MRGGIGDLSSRERLEEFFHQQHGEKVLINDQAGGIFVGELRIEFEPDPGEEIGRPFEVLHRQIDEDLGGQSRNG